MKSECCHREAVCQCHTVCVVCVCMYFDINRYSEPSMFCALCAADPRSEIFTLSLWVIEHRPLSKNDTLLTFWNLSICVCPWLSPLPWLLSQLHLESYEEDGRKDKDRECMCVSVCVCTNTSETTSLLQSELYSLAVMPFTDFLSHSFGSRAQSSYISAHISAGNWLMMRRVSAAWWQYA